MPNLSYSVADFVGFTRIRSADVNARFNDIKTLLNTTKLDSTNVQQYGLSRDRIAVGTPSTATFDVVVTNSQTTGDLSSVSSGLRLAAPSVTSLTVSSGGAAITGDSTITGNLGLTGVQTFTDQGSDPSTPASGKTSLYSKNKKFYLKNDLGAVSQVGSGSSGGGINYIGNPDAEVDTSGWAAYNDTATFTVTIASPAVVSQTAHGLLSGDVVSLSTTGALPTGLATATDYVVEKIDADSYYLQSAGARINTSGSQSGVHTSRPKYPINATGGSANITWTRSTSSPLRGTASFLWTKDAANRRGEGVSYDFTIEQADTSKLLAITLDLSASSNYVANDAAVWVYDVTNGVRIPCLLRELGAGSGSFITAFASSTSLSYRLIIHNQSENANSVTIKFDGFSLGPNTATPGLAGSATESAGVDATSFGTISSAELSIRRVGDTYFGRGKFIAGTIVNAAAYITLPNGLSAKLSKYPSATKTVRVGKWSHAPTSGSNTLTGTTERALTLDTAYPTRLYLATSLGDGGGGVPQFLTESIFGIIANNSLVSFEFEITVDTADVGVISSNSRVFNISTYLANGTRVTSAAPTQLGQYRSYLRNAAASTFTETNGSPATAPTASNGFVLYRGNAYNVADTNNNPTRYEIFIGLNKYPQVQAYSSTGKTGLVSITPTLFPGATFHSAGFHSSYDPTTGILVISAYRSLNGAADIHDTGVDATGVATTAALYAEVIVSDNPLPVQAESLAGDHEILLDKGNGFGSTNTVIRRFSTVRRNVGTAMTLTQSATLGDSILINRAGVYSVRAKDLYSGGPSQVGVSRNSTQLTTQIANITLSDIVLYNNSSAAIIAFASAVIRCNVGDVLRHHTAGTSTSTTSLETAFEVTFIHD